MCLAPCARRSKVKTSETSARQSSAALFASTWWSVHEIDKKNPKTTQPSLRLDFVVKVVWFILFIGRHLKFLHATWWYWLEVHSFGLQVFVTTSCQDLQWLMELKDSDFDLIDGWSGTPKLQEPAVEMVIVQQHLRLLDLAVVDLMNQQCNSLDCNFMTPTLQELSWSSQRPAPQLSKHCLGCRSCRWCMVCQSTGLYKDVLFSEHANSIFFLGGASKWSRTLHFGLSFSSLSLWTLSRNPGWPPLADIPGTKRSRHFWDQTRKYDLNFTCTFVCFTLALMWPLTKLLRSTHIFLPWGCCHSTASNGREAKNCSDIWKVAQLTWAQYRQEEGDQNVDGANVVLWRDGKAIAVWRSEPVWSKLGAHWWLGSAQRGNHWNSSHPDHPPGQWGNGEYDA